MKAPDDLFQLVKSMDKAEKRHFKIFAGQHTRKGSNHYIKLFDAIDSLEEYEEQLLLKRIKDPAIRRNLATNRFRLTNLILKSLGNLYVGRSVNMELREILKQIEVLFQKELTDLCRRMIKKAEKSAVKYECYLILLELIEWERKLFFNENVDHLKEKLQELYDWEMEIQAKFSLQNAYTNLKQQIVTLSRIRTRARNEEELAPFKEIVDHDLLKRECPTEDFFPPLHYHEIWGYYYVVKGDYLNSFKHFKENIAHWEENNHFKEYDPGSYLALISNYLTTCLFSEYWDEFREGLDSYRSFLPNVSTSYTGQRQNIFYLELLYCMNFAGYTAGCSLVEEYDEWISVNGPKVKISAIVNTFYNITLFYFLHSEYSNSLKWLNRILNLEKIETRQDIQNFARTFQLIIHFELDNLDLVEYLFRSTYRFLRKSEELFPLERIILDILKKTPGMITESEQKESFAEVKEKMLALGKSEGFRRPLGFQEMIFWLDSRIQGIPLKQVFEQKVRERNNA